MIRILSGKKTSFLLFLYTIRNIYIDTISDFGLLLSNCFIFGILVGRKQFLIVLIDKETKKLFICFLELFLLENFDIRYLVIGLLFFRFFFVYYEISIEFNYEKYQ